MSTHVPYSVTTRRVVIVEHDTGTSWAIVGDEVLKTGFKQCIMGTRQSTTSEYLTRAQWRKSLATVFDVDRVMSVSEWERYQKRQNNKEDENDEMA